MPIRFTLLTILLNATLLTGQILLSHNDYEQETPLHYAMSLGYEMIEADVYLRNDTLVVCHDEGEVDTAPTLLEMYIIPLTKYESDALAEKVLLLDIKEANQNILNSIENLRIQYPDVFKYVTILLSGDNIRMQIIDNPSYSNLKLDGRIHHLNDEISNRQMPIISAKITDVVSWNGCRRIKKSEANTLRDLIDKVHSTGRKIRFWNVEDKSTAWNVLKVLGVDIIGVDHLERYIEYQRTNTNN